jgi:hypothetical protein
LREAFFEELSLLRFPRERRNILSRVLSRAAALLETTPVLLLGFRRTLMIVSGMMTEVYVVHVDSQSQGMWKKFGLTMFYFNDHFPRFFEEISGY